MRLCEVASEYSSVAFKFFWIGFLVTILGMCLLATEHKNILWFGKLVGVAGAATSGVSGWSYFLLRAGDYAIDRGIVDPDVEFLALVFPVALFQVAGAFLASMASVTSDGHLSDVALGALLATPIGFVWFCLRHRN